MSQVLLASHQNDRKAVAEVEDLGNPLLLDVLKGIRGVDRETNKDDVGIRVRERAETIVVFLTSSIPQREFNVFTIDLYIGDVVLENSRDINLGECALRKHDEQTSLSTGTVADDNQLASDLGHYSMSVYREIRGAANEQ